MHRSFFADRYETRIRIGTAFACMVFFMRCIAVGQDTSAAVPAVAAPGIETPAEKPPDESAPAEEGMQEETSPEQQAVEQLTAPAQAEPTPKPVEPVFPWSQSSRAGSNQPVFAPPLAGTGVSSRLTVNPTRPSVARVYSGIQSQLGDDSGAYNLKIRRVRFRFGAGLRLEANDNINTSATNREFDLIVQPGIAVQGSWRLTKINSLDVSVTLSQAIYLMHPEKNQTNLQIAPGSQIALNIFAGDFRFTLHDRFSLQQDPVALSALSNTTNAALFTNDIGLTTTWDLNELILSLELDHVNFSSLQAQPNYPNRAADSVALFATTALNRGADAGVETGVSKVTYSSQNQTLPADGTLAFAGLFVEGRMSRFTMLRAAAGYQIVNGAASATRPANQQSGFYANLAVAQVLNPWINQTLDIGHELSAGLFSGSEENTYLRHSMNFRVLHRASLGTQLAVENYKAPGSPNLPAYTTYGGGILCNYRLTQKLSLATQYQFVYKLSDNQGQNYSQNRLVFDITYQF